MDAPKNFHGMVWGEEELEMDLTRAEPMARGMKMQVDL